MRVLEATKVVRMAEAGEGTRATDLVLALIKDRTNGIYISAFFLSEAYESYDKTESAVYTRYPRYTGAEHG